MADIKDQLIKDSYNYVLQSDLSTGIVYRIGGSVPINPIFSSGLTINSGFTYSNGTEQPGYVLLTDGTGYAYWGSVSGGTSLGPYLPLSGGTVTGNTTFTSGLTVNYIDFDTTPSVPSPTGGTLFYDSVTNSLSYKPITNNNDVTINLGQEGVIRIYNNTGSQIDNGKALIITGSTSGVPTVTLSIASGGNNLLYQVDGISTHDIPNGQFGFMTNFGVVNDINLSSFVNGEDIYLSQTIPGNFDSLSNLSFTGRTTQIGHVNDNGVLGKLQINIQNESILGLVTAKENNILTANNSSTGLFYFTGLTKVSSTQFNVSPVRGWIVDNTTNPINPSVLYVEYSGGTYTDLYIATANETFIYLTSAGTISQQTTILTGQQRRQNIFLGKLGHPDRTTINLVFSQPDSSLSPVSQLRDMFVPINLINGGVYPSTNGANLQFNTSAGDLYGLGINYVNNVLEPNKLSVSGTSPCTFQYRTQTGGTITNVTNIDPLNWDVNGVITPITGTKATNQRIYLLQNGTFRVQYGQTEYNQLSAAIAGISTEQFTVFPNFRNNAILIGILSVLSTATDLTDTSKAQFFLTSKFGESVGAAGGVSTTNLQQAYNNSTEPEITINSTLDGVSIKNGTGNADNTTSLLQGLNSGGTITSFIRADGLFSGSTVSTPGFTANTNGLTATTISATTYYNLPTDIHTTGATYSNNTFTFTNNTGGTYSVLFNTVTGLTVNGNLTVTGTTTSNTLSATTYQNLPFSGTVRGNGIINYIPKWTGSTGISNSTAFDDGSFFTIPNTYISNSFKFINAIYDGRVNPYNNLVLFENSNLVKPLSNEGFGGSENLNSGDSFLTLSNDSDSRAIEIFYNLRSTNDDNFRSGKIIANWDGTYTNFYQTEYGPNYDLRTMTFIDPPQVFYGGSGTIIRVSINFDDVTDPSNLLTARFKYVLI